MTQSLCECFHLVRYGGGQSMEKRSRREQKPEDGRSLNGVCANYRRGSSTASRASALGLDTLTSARSPRTIHS